MTAGEAEGNAAIGAMMKRKNEEETTSTGADSNG
jgi:hypothetical protein